MILHYAPEPNCILSDKWNASIHTDTWRTSAHYNIYFYFLFCLLQGTRYYHRQPTAASMSHKTVRTAGGRSAVITHWRGTFKTNTSGPTCCTCANFAGDGTGPRTAWPRTRACSTEARRSRSSVWLKPSPSQHPPRLCRHWQRRRYLMSCRRHCRRQSRLHILFPSRLRRTAPL